MNETKLFLGCGLVGLWVSACGGDNESTSNGGGTDGASAGATATDADTSVASTTGATASTHGDASATSSASTTHATNAGHESSDTTGDESGSTSRADDLGSTGDESTGSGSHGSSVSAGDQGNTGDELCEAPANLTPCDTDTNDPFEAIGLGCPYGDDEAIPVFGTTFSSPDSNAWRVAKQLGTYIDPNTNEPLWTATEGDKFLMISSSILAQPDGNGVLIHSQPLDHWNGNPDLQQLPAPMSPLMGSNNGNGGTPFVNCDSINDCSDSLQAQWQQGYGQANDLLWLQFSLEVPGGTHGFSFDFAYFSVEFTDFIQTTYNDMFVVWSSSETYTGNLCFVNDQPCTVTALGVDPYNPQQQYTESSPELVNTGFYGWGGGGTGWYEIKGSAAPGETLQLTWAIFDMGDSALDTAVIIDNFRWDCEGCTPSEINPCGIRPIPT